MKLIIDRFEGDYAICETEDRTLVSIEKSEIPSHAKEGDVLVNDGTKYVVDKEATRLRAKRINKLLEDLFE